MSEIPPVQPVTDNDLAINELLTRGIEEVYPSVEEFAEALKSGRRLTAYMGIDPTAPDMHVGHESQLLKLRALQELGHRCILLIGDFTAMIGDPTDKSATRVKLSREEVLANAQGYLQQASKVIDFNPESPNPAELAYNSVWLGEMRFDDVLELASEFTVQQMLERQMFRSRIDEQKPVGLHEFLYPMMQGYDSVAMKVDIEIGGSDQIFNMLVGTTLVKRSLKKQKYILAGKLLVDPSGRKIGKTEGNMITLNDEPTDMYHKIMLWGDAIAPHALELCSTMPMTEIRALAESIENGELTGLQAKEILAKRIVTDLHGTKEADDAEKAYHALTADSKEINRESLTSYVVQGGEELSTILINAGFASSKRAARELITAGAVRINEEKVSSEWTIDSTEGEIILQVGKKKRENYRILTRS